MNRADIEYVITASRILNFGEKKTDRTGTGTISVFGTQMRFDLREGFPLLTSKKLHWKSIVHELLWMLSGSTNIKVLQENGVNIWNEWADENGDLGPVYGAQWRSWLGLGEDGYLKPIDQIAQVIDSIKHNPDSRRHIVTAWNPAEVQNMALPPCHMMFQFYVSNGNLSCHLYQRSGDFFLGIPFNIASYSLLTHMVAQVCDLQPKEFIHTIGDAHIYLNHVDQIKEQIDRPWNKTSPTLVMNTAVRDIFKFTPGDFVLQGYDPHPAIKAPVAV